MREEILNITMTVEDEKVTGTATDQVRGPRGYSAYEVAVLLGYVGNEESWLESLKVKGDRGSSAYRVAVEEGFVGTVSEWRNSLIGPRGPVYDDSDLREQIDLELASLTRIASEAANVATTKAGEAVEAKNIVVLRADEVDGHAVILYGLFDEIEDYRQEVYRRALESIEQAGIATTKAGEAVISAGEAEQSAQDAAQSASEAEQTLIDKVSKTDIVQATGQLDEKIMSQKAVTDLFNNLIPWLGSEIPVGDAVFDFEKSRYAKAGVPVGLGDISEFIRLSSATMWVDGQLVEVANNIPRISGDGLLIEPQRTNILIRSFLTNGRAEGSSPPLKVEYVDPAFAQLTSDTSTRFDFQPYTATGYVSSRGRFPPSRTTLVNGENYSLSFYASHNSVNTPYVGDVTVYLSGDSASGPVTLPKANAGQSNIRYSRAWNHSSITGWAAPVVYVSTVIGSEVVSASINAVQVESGELSSFIPTTSSPATRSPDIFIIDVEPNQTITGDWDAGVTYEVADNIATFTGHGYIRNITVEAL